MSDSEDHADDTILVKSAFSGEDYVPQFELPLDNGKRITVDNSATMRELALHIIESCVRAEYDALVFKQLTKPLADDDARLLVGEFRAHRGFGLHGIAEVSFVPAVTMDGNPFVNIMVDGTLEGQLDVGPARALAVHILGAIPWSHLDNHYYSFLTDFMEVGEDPARGMINVVGGPTT